MSDDELFLYIVTQKLSFTFKNRIILARPWLKLQTTQAVCPLLAAKGWLLATKLVE